MNRKRRRAARKLSATASPGISLHVDEIFAQAVRRHQGGHLEEARRLYEQVLSAQPDHADGLHLLGVIAYQEGRLDVAVDQITKALAAKPSFPEAFSNLGNVLKTQGKLDDSVTCLRKAVALKPDFAEAHSNLASVLCVQGKLEEAIASCGRALELKPHLPEAYANLGNALSALNRPQEAVTAFAKALEQRPNYPDALVNLANVHTAQGNLDEATASYRRALTLKPHAPQVQFALGNALLGKGRLNEAAACYQAALDLQPEYPEAMSNLSLVFREVGRLDEAIATCRRALELRPNYAEACSNLGNALMDQGQRDEAITWYRKAVELKPDYPEALNNLGKGLQDQGRLDDAIVCFRQALALRPDIPEIHNNLGSALTDYGHLADAITCYKTAIALRPGIQQAYSNLLLTLHYAEGRFEEDLASTVQAYAEVMERTSHRTSFPNTPDTNRRLRIGYVSADFRAHPVGYFLLRVLAAHDRSKIEVFCYSNSTVRDVITAGLQATADHWRHIAGKPDSEVDASVRSDMIDILVDLGGHTAKNRLAVFAGRAAPVQATWLGYFGTTGLPTMDYIFADRFVVLPGEEAQFTEHVWRLPNSYLCFAPPNFEVPILARPTGDLVLGCFNNWSKISEATVSLWARLLSELPGSKLLLKTKFLDLAEMRRAAAKRFGRHGIASDRLILEGPVSRLELLAAYNRIDIALDPFPYGGGTTTAEALWMGVPVVTLRGDRWVGRVSESILTTIGLPSLVAVDSDSYLNTVRRLADDRPMREELRQSLRSKMESSPFCDGVRFAKSLDAAYRALWTGWCLERASK